MKGFFLFLLSFFFVSQVQAQKDSLQLGDRYADDQLYASISYAQFFDQPNSVSKSGFSYALSAGFMKDVIVNTSGSFSFAIGVGYGFDFFNHNLKVQEINSAIVFSTSQNISSNVFKSHNLEFPIELRWRTSTAKKYDFWRIYTGVKFLYNLSNKFEFTENGTDFIYKNISSFNNLQYGLTLSAGFDAFNVNVFYSLTPIFENSNIGGEDINSSILKFGFIFYIL